MSTYSDAKFILPEAPYYKSGKVYALKPTDATGDLTVVRATACDEIDSTGESVEVAVNTPRFDFRADYTPPTDNSYYSFDGTNDYVDVGTPTALQITDDITVIADINSNSSTLNQCIYGYTNGTNASFIVTYGYTDGKIEVWQSGVPQVESTTTLEVNTWYNVAVTRTGTLGSWTIKIYIDGVLDSTTVTSTNASVSGSASIGKLGSFAGYYWDGEIKNARVDNRALSLSEIDNHINGSSILSKYKGARGLLYSSDFSAGVDGFTSFGLCTVAGNVDGIGGENNNLSVTISSAAGDTRAFLKTNQKEIGKSYRVSFDYYIPSSNTYLASIFTDESTSDKHSVQDAWTSASSEILATTTDVKLIVGDSDSYMNPGFIGDVAYIRNVKVAEIGNVLNLSTGKTSAKWYDLDHPIQGTVNGATLTDSTNFGENVHSTNSCPVLLTEPSFTNYFLNSATPVTQTITTVAGTTYTCNAKGAGIITIAETSGKGGTATEVNPFTYKATKTSVDITLEAGEDFDWVQVTDTEEPMNHVATLGSTVTKAIDDISVTTPAGVTEIIETIEGVEQTPITTIPATYDVPMGRINSVIMN